MTGAMNVWRRGALASGTVRRLDLVVVVAGLGACLVAGLAAAERGSIALLLLVGMGGLALVTVFQEIGFGVLLVWIVLSGPLYPPLPPARSPRSSARPPPPLRSASTAWSSWEGRRGSCCAATACRSRRRPGGSRPP